MSEQLRDHLERLSEFGIELDQADSLDSLGSELDGPRDVALVHDASVGRFQMIYAPEMTITAMNAALTSLQAESESCLVLGERVTERSAEMLRAAGVNYLDRAGNASISFDGVRIDVRGRKGVSKPQVGLQRRSRGGTNLMSPKRAQVVFAMLSWAELLEAPVRDLAHAAGTSLGQAQETIQLLLERGYLLRSRRFTPQGRDALIGEWVNAYPHGLNAHIATLRLAGDIVPPQGTAVPLCLSGESAVGRLLRPETLTLYSAEMPRALIAERRWRRDDEHPTIFLRSQFWNEPGTTGEPGLRAAPPLLVYADLLASGDSRQREAAKEFWDLRDQLHAG